MGLNVTGCFAMASGQDNAQHAVDTPAQVHPATFTGANGNLNVIITLHAETLAQATTLVLALLQDHQFEAQTLDIVPTSEFDQDLDTIPELVSLAQAAEELHLSRPAARARIGRDLVGTKVGGSGWVVTRDSLAQAVNHTTR